MRFAIVNGERHLPEKGIQGATCPVCEKPVIARCGEIRAHHWAHAKGTECSDTWSSGKETDWHLAWKNEFPDEWQERVLTDSETGEKHIADVLTDKNLVLEFQHSPIDPDERRAREAFYSKDGRNMVWIVDALKNRGTLKKVTIFMQEKSPRFETWRPFPFIDEFFPKQWLHSRVPVLFDFGEELTCYDNNGECFPIMITLICDSKNRHIFMWTIRKKIIDISLQSGLITYYYNLLPPKKVVPPKTVSPQKTIDLESIHSRHRAHEEWLRSQMKKVPMGYRKKRYPL